MRDAKDIDLIAQAYSGLMSVTGTIDGQLAKAGFPVSDVDTGMWGAIGVLVAPYKAFTRSDRNTLVLGAVNRAWDALCRVIEIDLSGDGPLRHRVRVFPAPGTAGRDRPGPLRPADRDHWTAALREAGMPCEPVNGIRDILTDDHFLARGLFVHNEERQTNPRCQRPDRL